MGRSQRLIGYAVAVVSTGIAVRMAGTAGGSGHGWDCFVIWALLEILVLLKYILCLRTCPDEDRHPCIISCVDSFITQTLLVLVVLFLCLMV